MTPQIGVFRHPQGGPMLRHTLRSLSSPTFVGSSSLPDHDQNSSREAQPGVRTCSRSWSGAANGYRHVEGRLLLVGNLCRSVTVGFERRIPDRLNPECRPANVRQARCGSGQERDPRRNRRRSPTALHAAITRTTPLDGSGTAALFCSSVSMNSNI